MKWVTEIVWPSGHIQIVAEFEARYEHLVDVPSNQLDTGRRECNRDVGEVALWPDLEDGCIVRAMRDDGLIGRSITINRQAATIPTAEAAKHLGIAARTVQQHAASLGVGTKHGRDLYFSPADIDVMRTRVGKLGRPSKQPA